MSLDPSKLSLESAVILSDVMIHCGARRQRVGDQTVTTKTEKGNIVEQTVLWRCPKCFHIHAESCGPMIGG